MIGESTVTALEIAAVIYILFWRYPIYCLDKFRQEVFLLRDGLFDMAADGEIGFNDDAYRELRDRMNSLIRYAHKLSFLQAVVIVTFSFREPIDNNFLEAEDAWQEKLRKYDSDTQQKIENYRARMHLLMIRQILLGTPIVALTIVPLIGWWIIASNSIKFMQKLRLPLSELDWTVASLDKAMDCPNGTRLA